jgi:chaperone BCS1
MTESIYDLIKSQLVNNQLFVGMIMTLLIGGVGYALRAIPLRIFSALRYAVTVSIVARDDDDIYFVINEWAAQNSVPLLTKRLSINTRYEDNGTTWSIGLGNGLHLVWFNKRPFLISRTRSSEIGSPNRGRESIEIETFGFSRCILKKLIESINEYSAAGTTLDIYVWIGFWRRAARKERRPAKSLVLADGVVEAVLADARRFLSSKNRYSELGIPYRRGYLLAGPPGTGKSSLAAVIASELKIPLYMLNLSGLKNDAEVLDSFTSVPQRGAILIDDIDAMRVSLTRENVGNQNQPQATGCTLAGLLNAIDGVASSDGRIVIMATNRPELLDPALIRPGRIDYRIDFGPLDSKECTEFFLRFFPTSPAEAKEFGRLATGLYPAKIQQILMSADCAEKALELAKTKTQQRIAAE